MANTKDEIIERLIAENSFSNRIIAEIKLELCQLGEIDGLSVIAAVKSLVKKHKDMTAENTKLKEENKNLKRALDKLPKS